MKTLALALVALVVVGIVEEAHKRTAWINVR